MKWIAIAGAWRKINTDIENEVRKTVEEIINKGDGVVSGGALGVDYIALDETMKNNPGADQIKIFIPSSIETYKKHYHKRAEEGVITTDQASDLILQLETLKSLNPKALIEGQETVLDKTTYFNRITKIIEDSDELIAFHVNNSEGTQDTITKAANKGIPVNIFTYKID